jgi:hypothetical protein
MSGQDSIIFVSIRVMVSRSSARVFVDGNKLLLNVDHMRPAGTNPVTPTENNIGNIEANTNELQLIIRWAVILVRPSEHVANSRYQQGAGSLTDLD